MFPAAGRAYQATRVVWGGVALIGLLGVAGTYVVFVEPAPPKHLVLAAGRADSANYKFAQEYAAILHKEGFSLEVRATDGSVDNLRLLLDPQSDVGAALVQSGLADAAAAKTLITLGSLYREPLWIFHRGDDTITNLHQFAGQRVAIGPPGSGSRAIATALLAANGVTAREATLTNATGPAAAQALADGGVDAAFFVAAFDSDYIHTLLRDERIQLVSLEQQAAYLRRFPYLAKVDLPAGLVDLGRKVPPRNVAMVAPTAMLVARKDLPPSLTPFLIAAAAKVHAGGDLISTPGEFPAATCTDLPLSEDAEYYYKSGPPVLQRFLPFWLASPADRFKVMIIPLIVVLAPLLRAAPFLVRWRIRHKVFRWYSLLRAIDKKLATGMEPAEMRENLAKLRGAERQVLASVEVPLPYMEEFYNLQANIRMIEAKLEKALEQIDLAEGHAARDHEAL
jgi:TRAP transporter TAXI family solute receptor